MVGCLMQGASVRVKERNFVKEWGDGLAGGIARGVTRYIWTHATRLHGPGEDKGSQAKGLSLDRIELRLASTVPAG